MNPNEDTEFNDALRKHGILPPREQTPPPPSPPQSPKLESILSNASSSELQELEEDAIDSDTERMIASYRRQRLAELQGVKRIAQFGQVYPIGREDYTREVTDASKLDLPDEPQVKGTGVVCFLYKDGQVASTQLADQLKELARRHPRTKFVSIVGDKCIANYADQLCPTLIIYRGGNVTRQVVSWGGDGERRIAELEAMLILSLAITSPPQGRSDSCGRYPDEDGYEDDRERSSTNFRSPTQARTPTDMRTGVQNEDSDSDFDL